jgi:hypothetical protein
LNRVFEELGVRYRDRFVPEKLRNTTLPKASSRKASLTKDGAGMVKAETKMRKESSKQLLSECSGAGAWA